MTLLDDHPLTPSGGIDADALIEEARHRQRRRRRWVAGVLAMLVAIGAAVAFNMNDRGHPTPRTTPANTPAPTVPVSPLHNLPTEIVAAVYAPTSPTSGNPEWGTEVDLVSTRTGHVLRVLASGGQVVVIAQAGGHVFFLQIPQQRTGYDILREVAVSGGPVRTLGVGSMPTPSPNGRFLAYVSYYAWNDTSSLEVLDLATGTTTSMPLLPSFHAGVAALAWMSPGSRIALVVNPAFSATQLMVVDLGPHQHLGVGQAESLPASMSWVSLFRSSMPNTILGDWVPALETSTYSPRVVQIQLSAHGVTIANIGVLPPSCSGRVDAIDPSGQDVLCSGPLDIVRLVQGGYRVARSVSANDHVITSAAW